MYRTPDLQQIWNKYPNGTLVTRGMDMKWMRYYAARDWRIADLYGTHSEERFNWMPYRLYSLLPSRLPN
jgi:hypothetical protein